MKNSYIHMHMLQKGKTALHYAAEEGNVEIIDLLLTANADSTTIDNQKWTPVYYAVDSKRVDALDHLLSKHVPIMVDKEVKPIILVCVKGDYDENAEEIPKAQQCLELLLNDKYAKVDINASSYGHKNTALIYAVKENKVKMAAYLLSKGCKIDLVDVDGKSAIHYATKQLLLPMVKLLIEKNADVTISDAENYTPLMICAAVKVKGEGKATPEQLLTNLEIAKLILQRQIKMSPRKLNIGDVELGRTALHMAVEHGFFSLVEIILDAEPDLVDCTDNKNDTPLIYAARSDGTMRDRGIKIANILIDRGAKIDQSGDLKRTALHVAAQNGFKSLVEKLVDKDANIEKVDTYGFTPLMMASRVPSAENYDTGKLIVELGADIMKIDYKNRTALHHAAKCGNESFAKYLLRQAESIQADILSLMDSKADTAIHQAARNKHKGVVNLLMDAKAALLENHESHIAEDNILKLLERAAEGKFEAFNRRIFIDMMRFNNDRAVYHGPSVFSFIVKTVTEIFTDVNFLFKLVQGRNSTKETDESHKTNADPSNTGRVHFDPNKHPLIEMALRFPTETHNIISSMAPVKSHPVLVRNFDFVASVEEDDFQVMGTMDNVPRPKDLNDDEDEEDDIKLADKTKREEEYLALHGNKDCFELWHNALVKKSFIRDTISVLNNVEVAEVSSYTIEIPFVSSMEFLEACVIISERTGQKDIFRHEVVKVMCMLMHIQLLVKRLFLNERVHFYLSY